VIVQIDTEEPVISHCGFVPRPSHAKPGTVYDGNELEDPSARALETTRAGPSRPVTDEFVLKVVAGKEHSPPSSALGGGVVVWRRAAFAAGVVSAAVLVLAGCGGEAVADPIDEGEIQVEMEEVDDSNAVGVRALISYVDENSSRIRVDGAGPGEPSTGGRLVAAVVAGSCADPGSEAFTVGELDQGSVTRTIETGLPSLLEGDYAIQVKSAAVGVIACGDLPDRMPS
jgi:hypothetical protein